MKKYSLIVIILIVILNLLGFSGTFCDLYADSVYGVFADAFGILWSALPFAAGEILMYAAVPVLLLLVVFLILLVFLRKRKGYVTFAATYAKCVMCIFVTVLLLYTLNWSLPMRSSLMGKKNHADREYSLEEYEALRNHVTQKMNEAVLFVPRDTEGNIILYEKTQAEQKTAAALKSLAADYPRLYGYYPSTKPALCSDVLDWMGIGGYTYPYTLEITCNKYVDALYYPALYAHESAHHQGFYRENEANFIEFLACAKSDDPCINLAGYTYIYSYVDDAYQSKLMETYEQKEALERYDSQIKPDRQVSVDMAYAQSLAREAYKLDVHPLEKYTETAEEVSEKGWKTQERILKEDSYDGVVPLLLEWYTEQ